MAIRWRYFTPTVCSRCRFSRHALYFFMRSDASARSLAFPPRGSTGYCTKGSDTESASWGARALVPIITEGALGIWAGREH
jgi:hypothetical protein